MKKLIQLTTGFGLIMAITIQAQSLSPQWAEIGVQSEGFAQKASAVNNEGELYTLTEFYDVVYVEQSDVNVPLAGTGGADFILQKRGTNGELLWSKVYGGFGNELVSAMEISDAGDIYLAGSFSESVNFGSTEAPYEIESYGGQDAFIMKLDQDGVLQWVDHIGTGGAESVTALSVDKDDYLVVAGLIENPTDMDAGDGDFSLLGEQGLYVKKLSQDGDFIWAKELGSTDDFEEDFIEHIVLDGEHVYFAGRIGADADMSPGLGTFNINTNDNGVNAFVEKLDVDGNLLYVNEIDGIGADRILHMDVSENSIWLLGSFYGTFDADPGPEEYFLSTSEFTNEISDDYLIKYDKDGTLIHAGVFEASGGTVFRNFSIDEFDKVYLIGAINGQIDLSPGEAEELYTNTTNEAFILKLGGDTEFEWIDVIDSAGSIWDTNLIIRPEGQLYFTGAFHELTDFDPGPGTVSLAPTLSTVEFPIATFHVKYNGLYIGLEEEIQDQNFTVYPNPTAGKFNVSFGAIQSEVNIKIVDITGRLVQESNYEQTDNISIEITGVPSVCFVEISTESGIKTFQKIIKYSK